MLAVHDTQQSQHVMPACCAGVKNLLEEEAIRVGGANHSHATQDLYDSIAKGDYPEWTLYIQTLDPADEHRCCLGLCMRRASCWAA